MKRENKKEELKILAYRLDYLKTFNKFFKIEKHYCKGYDVHTIINGKDQYCFNAISLSDLNSKLHLIFSFLQNEKLSQDDLKSCPNGCNDYEHFGQCFNPSAKRDIKNLIEDVN